MLLKMSGCVLIMLCTVGFGVGASWRLSRRALQLRQFEDFINALSRELTYSLESVEELLCGLYSWTEFSNMGILKIYINEADIISLPFPERWEEAVKRTQLEVSPAERQEMVSLPEILGTTDAISQSEALKVLELKICQRRKEVQSKYENRSKVYQTLGITLGIGICIMLI